MNLCRSFFRSFLLFLISFSFSVNVYAVSPQIVNSLYNYANKGQYSKIQYLVKMGYPIDVRDDNGYTAYCLAKEKDNTTAMRVLISMGADKNQNCSQVAWGKVTGTVAGVAAVGGIVAALASGGGGGGGGSSDQCAGVMCGENATCSDGQCFCNSGFVDFGGTCYAKISCQANAHQENDQCVCDTGFIDQGGTCYQQLTCGENASQILNSCVCNDGFIGDGMTCDPDLDCAVTKPNSTQVGGQCVCNSGYIEGTDDVCYAKISCQANAHQENDQCVCDTGFVDQGGTCYQQLACVNGTQQGDACICNEHALGDLCESCETGFGHDGSGACVIKAEAVYGSATKMNYNPGTMSFTNDKYADVYGIYYDPSAAENVTLGDPNNLYNAYASIDGEATEMSQTSSINIINNGDGNVYGLYSENTSNIYNLFVDVNKSIQGSISATIKITNKGNGDVFGMAGRGTLHNVRYTSTVGDDFATTLAGHIDIENIGSGSAYGMYAEFENVNNESSASSIKVRNTGSKGGNAYGIYADKGSVINSGSIIVSSHSGNAYGIYANGGNVDNSGAILVSGGVNSEVYGIYANGGSVNNSGAITVDGTDGKAYGIFATNGATVINTGNILLNDVKCDQTTCTGLETFGNHIVLDGSSTLVNAAVMKSEGVLDFNSLGGKTFLSKGGQFEARQLVGDLNVSADVVQGGFEDLYILKDALQADDINVRLNSGSAMFVANQQTNGSNGKDVSMQRTSFATLSSDNSIANFLEENYQNKNNESLYNVLKQAGSSGSYRQNEAKLLGYGLLPNFSRENLNILRHLTSVINNELFQTTGEERKMIGYDYLSQSRHTKGTLTGYDNYANTMYFVYDSENEKSIRTGFGMSLTQLRSDYDDDSSRKGVMVQALFPVSYQVKDNLGLASVMRVGYGDGSYKRHVDSDTFESDLTEWIYGISNAARYQIDYGWAVLEPAIELNILGYYQNRIRENKDKTNAIFAKGVNNLSVETGLGFALRKEVQVNDLHKLNFTTSMMYYHEFAHPYHSLDATIYGMSGQYRITDYEGVYGRDRGVISAEIGYDWKKFTFYGKYYQFIEAENPINVSLGFKYNY